MEFHVWMLDFTLKQVGAAQFPPAYLWQNQAFEIT